MQANERNEVIINEIKVKFAHVCMLFFFSRPRMCCVCVLGGGYTETETENSRQTDTDRHTTTGQTDID